MNGSGNLLVAGIFKRYSISPTSRVLLRTERLRRTSEMGRNPAVSNNHGFRAEGFEFRV